MHELNFTEQEIDDILDSNFFTLPKKEDDIDLYFQENKEVYKPKETHDNLQAITVLEIF